MALTSSAFLETIIALLLPQISANATDIRSARNEILGLLMSYNTRTRAECLLAAQIIALGMATLEALAEPRSVEMSASMRLRRRGNANSLNRAALQTTKALDQSLGQPLPQSPFPQEPAAQPEPPYDQPAPEQAADPDLQPFDDRNKRIWAAAMIDCARQFGLPAGQLTGQPPQRQT